MNEEYKNPVPREEDYEEAEIDWMGIITKLLKGWKFILIVSVIFGMLGIAAALLQKRTYGVTMTLAPEVQRSGSSSLNSITAMLGMGGASAGSTSDALNITLFPEICKSTPFLTDLFPVKLTPYVSRENAKNGVKATPVTVFDHLTGADKPKKGLKVWLKNLLSKEEEEEGDESAVNPSQLTKKQAAVARSLSQSISADVDKKTGVTTISVVMDDPLMATQLADTVCRRLQEYVIMYRTQKATDDFNYYVKLADEAHDNLIKAQSAYAASVDYDRNVILQSVNSRRDRLRQEAELASQIYSQMAQQREMARAKIQEEKPVFAVVQPATMPQTPMNSRKKTVLIWGFLGFFLSCAWVGFGKDFLAKMRGGVKERLEEEKEEKEEA